MDYARNATASVTNDRVDSDLRRHQAVPHTPIRQAPSVTLEIRRQQAYNAKVRVASRIRFVLGKAKFGYDVKICVWCGALRGCLLLTLLVPQSHECEL
ncbi:hypothetical protein BaRGS_00037980 [Batillaria attramentaria]|uniref:Uncharacterized protein n=1 Tax=Batillaria attramentaria TaxID=370345 RepID=A0ABD0J797_9CAEN